MDDDWPFDADRNDPLAKLRIPVVSNPFPAWKYEVCVVINDIGPGRGWTGLRPDEREVKQILAELDWRMKYYNEGWKAKMRRRPLDVDATTNTLILQRYAEDDWKYRRMSFETGPWPYISMDRKFTLEQLLDHINDHGGEPNPEWHEHKAKYPEAFGEVRTDA